jgi:dipeptidyl aminopeptidase/acylaminoacyl peptidase
MNKNLLLGLGAGTAIAVGAAILVPSLRDSVHDPETARCNAPAVHVGSPRAFGDRKEIDVRFTCSGATLTGTLATPRGPGPFPAAVWVHGSGPSLRLTYSGAPLVRALVDAGVAVFSYDKRGVGESTGDCCPGDSGHFNVLAADAAGALAAVERRPDIDPARVGYIGASQAGWVVPLAVSRTTHLVAFTALADSPVVSYGQERAYSHLTGDEGGDPSGLPLATIAERVRADGPSAFDPWPYVREMAHPSLWLYGGKDRSQPTALDVERLATLQSAGRDIRTIVYPDADHGLLDVPATDKHALPALVQWVRDVTLRSMRR